MSNLAVAAICSIPLWLTCAGVLLEDAIPAWRRRWQRNRAIRQLRQRDELAARRHRAARRMVSGGRSL